MSRVAEPMHRHAAVAIEEWLRHQEQPHGDGSTQHPAQIPQRIPYATEHAPGRQGPRTP
jgi:hypothetical protein